MNHRFPAVLTCLLLVGCAAAPTTQSPLSVVAYTPAPSPAHIAGSATIEATYDPSPEITAKWKRQGFAAPVIERHRQEVVNAVANDLANCGLFTRILPVGTDSHPDYIVKAQCGTEQTAAQTSVHITLTIVNGADGSPAWNISKIDGNTVLGPITGPQLPLARALPILMAVLKSDLAAAIARKTKADAEHAEIVSLKTASLADLLVASDGSPTIARERNRAIVAAKNEQLPGILRTWKTDQLSALVVKIEQTILDLNHECELAKDKAQQSVADGTSQSTETDAQNPRMNVRGRGRPAATGQPRDSATNSIEAQRDLSISYSERIELLKPILAALKDEIANRNR